MHGTGGNIALHAVLYFFENRSPVGSISKSDDREHHRLLEGSKSVGHSCLHCRLEFASRQLRKALDKRGGVLKYQHSVDFSALFRETLNLLNR